MKTIMTLALLCALAQGAWAEAVSYIYYTVDEETHVVTKHTDGSQATYTTISSSQRELRGGWYVVNKNVTINTKERLDCYGNVNIILKDGCTLTVPKGIRVSTDCTLNIYAQSEDEATMGGIHAEGGGEDWAAIGGHKNYRGGTLNIHGGNIYAEAKHNNAAGIGGGNGDGSGMVAINIFGGKVEAHGKSSGAGIGGGQHNNKPGTISIYGGNVTATGGNGGAGIGGGEDASIGMTTSTAEAENTVENDLHGVDVATAVSSVMTGAMAGCTPFVLSYKDGTGFGFFEYTGANLPAQKAFLAIDETNLEALARGLTMTFGDDATGIHEITDPTPGPSPAWEGSSAWFTLDGRKLGTKPTQKGVYIYKGKKRVIE